MGCDYEIHVIKFISNIDVDVDLGLTGCIMITDLGTVPSSFAGINVSL